MNQKFRSLILAYPSTDFNGFLLGVIMAAGALRTAALDIPTTLWIMDNMMRIPCHLITPYVLSGSK